MNADIIKAMIGQRAQSYRDRAAADPIAPQSTVYGLIAMTLATVLADIDDLEKLETGTPAGNSIRVGDSIWYRPGFGHDQPRRATVTGITVTEFPRGKHGESVTQVSHGIVQQNRAVFDLDHCSWCYSSQVDLPGKILDATGMVDRGGIAQ